MLRELVTAEIVGIECVLNLFWIDRIRKKMRMDIVGVKNYSVYYLHVA